MKIPFDIKFRPQIESGEYKVVTGDDRPVRIISWDKKAYCKKTEIVALVLTPQDDTETVQFYHPDGILVVSTHNEKFRLFLVTPEPELTEFEKVLDEVIRSYRCDSEQDENGILNYQNWIKRKAKNLIELAKKELCKDCTAYMDGYAKGRLDSLYEISRVYKHEGPTAFWPPCYYGGQCTNPFRDCINCPNLSLTGINITTGTSTKMEEKK